MKEKSDDSYSTVLQCKNMKKNFKKQKKLNNLLHFSEIFL